MTDTRERNWKEDINITLPGVMSKVFVPFMLQMHIILDHFCKGNVL